MIAKEQQALVPLAAFYPCQTYFSCLWMAMAIQTAAPPQVRAKPIHIIIIAEVVITFSHF